MTEERLNRLLQVTGPIIPEAMEEHIADLETTETELLPRDFLISVLEMNRVPREKQKPLLEALEAVNAVPELVDLLFTLNGSALTELAT